jgi:hypothetical protein
MDTTIRYYLSSSSKIKIKTLSYFYEDAYDTYGDSYKITSIICKVAEENYEKYKEVVSKICNLNSVAIYPEMESQIIYEIENLEEFVKWIQ